MRRTVLLVGLWILTVSGVALSADWRESYRQAISDDNPSRAARIVQEEAALNNAEAEYTLGMLYQAGQGVGQDDAQAHAWMTIGFEHGFRRGEDSLKFIEKKLAPGQLLRAKQLADGIRSSKGMKR